MASLWATGVGGPWSWSSPAKGMGALVAGHSLVRRITLTLTLTLSPALTQSTAGGTPVYMSPCCAGALHWESCSHLFWDACQVLLHFCIFISCGRGRGGALCFAPLLVRVQAGFLSSWM
ncbi:unnamed protein product [Discosporangium mesarthrocarpum]